MNYSVRSGECAATMVGTTYLEAVSQQQEALPRRIKFKPAIRAASGALQPGVTKKIEKTAKSGVKARRMSVDSTESFPGPARSLYPQEKIDAMISWTKPSKIGSGLANLGNTCFLNSVLQCLTYTPPLANFCRGREHSQSCRQAGFCMLCAFERHVDRALKTSGGSIAPKEIVSNLRAIAKHFRFGRQEDSHEFARYVIEGMRKSCLRGMDEKLDPRVAATCSINRIFGGYLRSQVKCMSCSYESNTYDPFLDLSLELAKGCDDVERCFRHFTHPEILDGDNKYKCAKCKNYVRAMKRFTVHQAPRVLMIQLKRFDFLRAYGGKINKMVEYPENLEITKFMSNKKVRQQYQLYGVLVHAGGSVNSGHYYAYVKNSNGMWYNMDDSFVSIGLFIDFIPAANRPPEHRKLQPQPKHAPPTPTAPVANGVANGINGHQNGDMNGRKQADEPATRTSDVASKARSVDDAPTTPTKTTRSSHTPSTPGRFTGTTRSLGAFSAALRRRLPPALRKRRSHTVQPKAVRDLISMLAADESLGGSSPVKPRASARKAQEAIRKEIRQEAVQETGHESIQESQIPTDKTVKTSDFISQRDSDNAPPVHPPKSNKKKAGSVHINPDRIGRGNASVLEELKGTFRARNPTYGSGVVAWDEVEDVDAIRQQQKKAMIAANKGSAIGSKRARYDDYDEQYDLGKVKKVKTKKEKDNPKNWKSNPFQKTQAMMAKQKIREKGLSAPGK